MSCSTVNRANEEILSRWSRYLETGRYEGLRLFGYCIAGVEVLRHRIRRDPGGALDTPSFNEYVNPRSHHIGALFKDVFLWI
jgi:hypothetical protein